MTARIFSGFMLQSEEEEEEEEELLLLLLQSEISAEGGDTALQNNAGLGASTTRAYRTLGTIVAGHRVAFACVLCVSFLAWEQPVHYVLRGRGRVPRYRSRPGDAARAPVREARGGTLDGTLLVLGSLALLVPRVDLAVDVRDVAPLDEVARLAPGVMDSSG